MKSFEILLAHSFIQTLGWALLHFIWQGALLAGLLASASALLRKHSANARYLLSCATLLLMLIAPTATVLFTSIQSPAETVIDSARASAIEEISRANYGAGATEAQRQAIPSPPDAQRLRQRLYEQLSALLPWVVLAWMTGVALFSFRLLSGWLYAHRLRRRGTWLLAEAWQQRLIKISRELGVTRPVEILESALVQVPAVIGWLRPLILLPTSALTGLTPQQLEAIIAHELAHVRRHDYLINLLQTTVETLLFYHPAVWWVSRRIRAERENCCDDIAVAACGDALTYARALTELEQLRAVEPRLAVAANGGSLINRVRRVVGVQPPTSNHFTGLLAISVILVFVSVGAGARVSIVHDPTSKAASLMGLENSDITENGNTLIVSRRLERQSSGANAGPQSLTPEPTQASVEDKDDQQPFPAPTPSVVQEVGIPEEVAGQIKALASRDPQERASAACSLGRAGARAAIPFLIRMLGDDAAIEPLACWSSGSWSPAIQTLKSPTVGEQAAIALAAMSAPAVEPLIAVLEDNDPSVRRNAAWAIGEIRGGLGVDRSAAAKPLIAALKDDDWWVRLAAAFSLGEMRDDRASEPLIVALTDNNPAVREMAAHALGEMKDARAIGQLIAALLSDESSKVRRKAAWALGEIRDPLAVDALTTALNDEDQHVRRTAKWALAEIRD